MSRFQYFKEDISEVALPEAFTFPFYYEPHPLAEIAVKEVQQYLENQTDFEHNFGLDKTKPGYPLGKMFGVLVVKNPLGEIGYLAAFSGNLMDKSLPDLFVPPIFNMRTQGGFFLTGVGELNIINETIEKLEADPRLAELQQIIEEQSSFMKEDLEREKASMREARRIRKEKREEGRESLSPEDFEALRKELEKESHWRQHRHKVLANKHNEELQAHQAELETLTGPIEALKVKRKRKSGSIQQQLFDQYQFLNKDKKEKGLSQIFANTTAPQPPSGAGDCAAPKLLQYAFAHDMQPLTMAEFWWGASPKKEIRKHKNYYPACQGRCKPILGHMLKGIKMDENPFLQKPPEEKKAKVVFEDDHILILNKPAELMTVPGRQVEESVFTQISALYPEATGPLIVHRLDMSTSGILLIAKTKDAHKRLQKQFIQRTVKKRYVALLDGVIDQDAGEINLPLRGDLNDRPRQMVCHEHGKPARTNWKVAERRGKKTLVYFYPVTGRTHQLRVHAAHPDGLYTPIVGDDLYGIKADRLYLHAEGIEFEHPGTRKRMYFKLEADF